jgi:hypothetical protein
MWNANDLALSWNQNRSAFFLLWTQLSSAAFPPQEEGAGVTVASETVPAIDVPPSPG